jgi:hypothetical protein
MVQLNKFFIRFWLTFAIASFLYACYMVYATGWEAGASNFVIPFIAIVWWALRRFMSARIEKGLIERQEREKQ